MKGNVPSIYTVAGYIAELRAMRATGSATAETSYYPPIDRLLNASGQALNPPVLFSTQLRNSAAGHAWWPIQLAHLRAQQRILGLLLILNVQPHQRRANRRKLLSESAGI